VRSRGGERILLVEDEAAVRKLAARLLKAEGSVVLEASNGHEAIELLARRAEGVELLLTDVVMPRMSGVELGARLTAKYPALRVLYMSGYAENAVGHFEDLNESEHFIGKPFSAADLCQAVRKILDGQ
jgi:CheY-like chemotaxis protein